MLRQMIVIEQLTREVASMRVVFRPAESYDHFETPLSWRSFKLGTSDYDIPADEAYCPCGAVVHPPDDREYAMLGDFVDVAEEHIAEAHPGARR
jgi:hypothetical protein